MQSPTLNRRSIVGGIAALAAALSARGAFAQADKPVRIGFSMARTGMLANATPSQSNTYELWKEQVNARGGMDVGGHKRKVEFVTYDDQSKPEQAVRIYEKLITDDKVDLLLAPRCTPLTTIGPCQASRIQRRSAQVTTDDSSALPTSA
jgi:branched-chain amino acid transport system substrate-binding protein